jgi:hypothetical protein
MFNDLIRVSKNPSITLTNCRWQILKLNRDRERPEKFAQVVVSDLNSGGAWFESTYHTEIHIIASHITAENHVQSQVNRLDIHDVRSDTGFLGCHLMITNPPSLHTPVLSSPEVCDTPDLPATTPSTCKLWGTSLAGYRVKKLRLRHI